MVNDARNDAIALELAQLLDQHLLRDTGNGPLEIGEASHLSAEELKQDDELPAPLKHLDDVLQTLRSHLRRVSNTLTSG